MHCSSLHWGCTHSRAPFNEEARMENKIPRCIVAFNLAADSSKIGRLTSVMLNNLNLLQTPTQQSTTDLCFFLSLSYQTNQLLSDRSLSTLTRLISYSPNSLLTNQFLLKSDLYILPSLQLTSGHPLLATSSTSLSSTLLH